MPRPGNVNRVGDYLLASLGLLGRLRPSVATCGVAVALALVLGGAWAYRRTQQVVLVEVNGVELIHRTHSRSPRTILREMRLGLEAEDQLLTPLETDLRPGAPLRIQLAREMLFVHDGSVTHWRSQARTVGKAVAEAGVLVLPHDQLYLNDIACTSETPLPILSGGGGGTLAAVPNRPLGQADLPALLSQLRRPARLGLRRAVPLAVRDGGAPATIHTTARTVGEALYERGLVLYAADRIFPGLETPVVPGLLVTIERSRLVTLDVGGRKRAMRTRLRTLAELLADEGVVLGPKDYAVPPPATPISRGIGVAVVRVADEYYLQELPIPYQARLEPDPEMEIDDSRVSTWGREGARRQLFRIHYENGQEVYRVEEEEWIARDPQDRITNYGTRIIPRTLETPFGPVTYWRHLRMYATAYSPSTSGTSPSAPWYGITRSGLRATRGIVAVDRSVIKLGQPLYVPRYGLAVAGDTGGGVKGRWVDLCYDDHNLEPWHQWVDVYLLTPAPPPSQINYRIPNSPKEKG